MEIPIQERLFWYLKPGTKLDLSSRTQLDLYIQQVLTRGRTGDVKRLLKMVDVNNFIESFGRIKKFLPKEVKNFWEEWIGDIDESTKRNAPAD